MPADPDLPNRLYRTPVLTRRLIIMVLIFTGALLIALSAGRYEVPLVQVLRILANQVISLQKTWTGQMENVVINIRLPRILAAALVGAALSGAGSVYQGMFRNPMVSPDVLGSSAGAGLGAALGIMCGFGALGISAAAFACGLAAVLLAVFIASRYKSSRALGLVLAGIMIGSLFSAGTSFLKLAADPTDQLPAITYWLMGSLASIDIRDVHFLAPVVVIGLALLFLLRWRLNVITLSDEESRSLGVDAGRLRILLILISTLMTAMCVAVSGLIGWVGLVIPHLARGTVGCDYKHVLPASILMGGSFLLIVDTIARTLATSEIPIGIMTAFAGAPFFLILILRGGKHLL